MRAIVKNKFGYITVMFQYHNGTGYAQAYGGGQSEHAGEYNWMPFTTFPKCKSREEAELRALEYLVNGTNAPDSNGYIYNGFTRNAVIQLFGFSEFRTKMYKEHTKNEQLWLKVIESFTPKAGNKFRFDIVRIDDTYSKQIINAKKECWKASGHDERMAKFNSLVATAEANRSASAKATKAAKAKAKPAQQATVKKVVA